MITLLSWQFWVYALLFCVSSFFVYVVPGWFLLHIAKLDKGISTLSTFVLAVCLGLTTWAAQGYIFGYAHLRGGTYLYVVGSVGIAFLMRAQLSSFLKKLGRGSRRAPLLPVAVLLLGVGLQLFQVFGSGLVYSEGVKLFRTHAYDGLFHVGLIEHMILHFPPNEPSASGMQIANYHYWSDLMMAEQARIFHIPVSFIFFQYMPVLVSVLTALALVSLLKQWKGSTAFIFFALFFLFFGADAGFLITYLAHHVFNFNYPVIDNGITQFLNMPHAMAKASFFGFLLALQLFIQKKRFAFGIVTAILCAVLFGEKIYFGLFGALALALFFFCEVFVFLRTHGIARGITLATGKRGTGLFVVRFAIICVLGALCTLAIYLPANSKAGGLGFYPLEWPKLFINPANIDWTDMRYRIAIAQLEHNGIRLFAYNVIIACACLLAVHGTRLLGLAWMPAHWKFFGRRWMLFFIVGTALFTFAGLFTLQSSGTFNVFNFFAVSTVILSICAAYMLAALWKSNRVLGGLLIGITLILTLPRGIYETVGMYERYTGKVRDVVIVSPEMIDMFAYMRTHAQPDAVIQSAPKNDFENSSTIAAFTGRQTYIEGVYLLDTHNQPFKDREEIIKNLFRLTDKAEFTKVSRSVGIQYVIYQKDADKDEMTRLLFLTEKPFYENMAVVVYDMKQ